jgi:uncharacterized glyoxalase superfamily protein PhnB
MLSKLWTNMMVDDIHRTIDFYRQTLGFEHIMSVPKGAEEVHFKYDAGRPLIYAAIRCGGIELMLQERESLMENVPAFEPGAATGGTLTFYFETDDIESLAQKLRGVCEVVRDLHDTFYGMREIYVRDPNGYVLGFAQPVRHA